MYGVIEVGKYNVSFEGLIYDNKIPYEMVIIEAFNENVPIKGSRKVLYFRQNANNENKFIIPEFTDEKSVEMFLKYRNYSKLQVYNKTVIEKI